MPRPKARYKIAASDEGFTVEVSPEFWDARIIKKDGTTALDYHIDTLLQELRLTLYYVAQVGHTQH